jgi:hypothetical protein
MSPARKNTSVKNKYPRYKSGGERSASIGRGEGLPWALDHHVKESAKPNISFLQTPRLRKLAQTLCSTVHVAILPLFIDNFSRPVYPIFGRNPRLLRLESGLISVRIKVHVHIFIDILRF